MQAPDDIELLRRYAAEKAEDAFSTLVARHVNFVYSAALRQVRNPHAAQDVTQAVFVLLARKAHAVGAGPNLAGWLYRATGYVAAETLRSENRRRLREQAAMEPLHEAKEPSLLDHVEPELDGAIRELGETDRAVLLQRFFQNKSLKELGGTLGITEDAAQKRVARALEKLRDRLIRRGVAVTSVSLAGALGSISAHCAPPALVGTIVAAAVAPTTLMGISLATSATLTFMAWTKLKTAIVIAALAAIPIALQQRALHNQSAKIESLNEAMQAFRPKAALVAPGMDPAEVAQLRRDAAEVHKLRAQVAELMRDRNPAPVAHPNVKLTTSASATDHGAQNNPTDRQSRGEKLMAEGKLAEALEEFLWCYDEGAKQSPSYVGVRGSYLLMRLKELASHYPAAKDALAARRDAAELALQENYSANDPESILKVMDVIRLNESLDDPTHTLSLFDKLPAASPARGKLVELAMDQFIQANRFQDIVSAGNPEASFDQQLLGINMSKRYGVIKDEDISSLQRRNAIDAGGRGIQALATVGQVDRANALIDKVLKFDQTPETRGELLKYAERSGNPQVIGHIKSN